MQNGLACFVLGPRQEQMQTDLTLRQLAQAWRQLSVMLIRLLQVLVLPEVCNLNQAELILVLV